MLQHDVVWLGRGGRQVTIGGLVALERYLPLG